MSVTVPTKDVGDVKDVYRKSIGFKLQLEDKIQYYIKREFKIL